jgi:hypothetical protein
LYNLISAEILTQAAVHRERITVKPVITIYPDSQPEPDLRGFNAVWGSPSGQYQRFYDRISTDAAYHVGYIFTYIKASGDHHRHRYERVETTTSP